VGPSDFANAVKAKQGSGQGGCLSDFVNAVKAKQGSGLVVSFRVFVNAVKAKQGSWVGLSPSESSWPPSRPSKDLNRDIAFNDSGI
jgi:hypothetical protein